MTLSCISELSFEIRTLSEYAVDSQEKFQARPSLTVRTCLRILRMRGIVCTVEKISSHLNDESRDTFQTSYTKLMFLHVLYSIDFRLRNVSRWQCIDIPHHTLCFIFHVRRSPSVARPLPAPPSPVKPLPKILDLIIFERSTGLILVPSVSI
jgi:hypothetical protein